MPVRFLVRNGFFKPFPYFQIAQKLGFFISEFLVRIICRRLRFHRPVARILYQRAGRCGRVAAGVCIRLYDEQDYLQRPKFTEPEILRSSLAAVILHIFR